MNDHTRFTRLEENVTHLQRHVTEQDKVILGLTEEIARLKQDLAGLRTQQASNGAPDTPPGDERPPHY
jgi:phage shock protein A